MVLDCQVHYDGSHQRSEREDRSQDFHWKPPDVGVDLEDVSLLEERVSVVSEDESSEEADKKVGNGNYEVGDEHAGHFAMESGSLELAKYLLDVGLNQVVELAQRVYLHNVIEVGAVFGNASDVWLRLHPHQVGNHEEQVEDVAERGDSGDVAQPLDALHERDRHEDCLRDKICPEVLREQERWCVLHRSSDYLRNHILEEDDGSHGS